ncbi:MAG: TonB-dependent receptor plug domain-containing protein [Bacteroidetes bacterium]|nr:TonB-dependent receptor plug domain-containing protein [Bacteroidota bacterium]
MIRSTVYSLLCFLWIGTIEAQTSFKGRVLSATDSLPLAGVEVYDFKSEQLSLSDSAGYFQLSITTRSELKLGFFLLGFESSEMIWNPKEDVLAVVYLEEQQQLLEAVTVSARAKSYERRSLNAVEGAEIYASKKTEVLRLAALNLDLGANKPRQIYAQISGLNIYEGSDGGLQLNVGGRGLDPNRSSNFNVRQNGYDISADVLGYPESYYTPPPEAIAEIQVVKGAASLQYGTQFGGLLQFKLAEAPEDTALAIQLRQSYGSFGRLSSFIKVGGTKGRWSYLSYFNYKQGAGWRANSDYQANNFFANISYKISPSQSLNAELSLFNSLAQQAGGLSDSQFDLNPQQSSRSRNWFKVNWQLYALKHSWKWSAKDELFSQVFALSAKRQALGFRGLPQNFNQNPILSIDEQDADGNFLYPRDLMRGVFSNWGMETKWLRKYRKGDDARVFLLGLKYYHAQNQSRQGAGSRASDPDFSFYNERHQDYPSQSEFVFPNRNWALFSEHIWFLGDKWSITPGLRAEYISTASAGSYLDMRFDNAGNLIFSDTLRDDRKLERAFVIAGLGVSYRPSEEIEGFFNISQNYRSVTFSDIRTVNPTFVIDPEISDEKGFSSDLGLRGSKGVFQFDLSVFSMLYANRIGIILNDRAQRVRKNMGTAFIYGLELFAKASLPMQAKTRKYNASIFVNLALTDSRYLQSEESNVIGNRLEFIPRLNFKSGLDISRKAWHANFQFSALSEQFTDVENSSRPEEGDLREGLIGPIPAYAIWDFSLSYRKPKYELGLSLNNLANRIYFTRRATGYPGPGIIPSDPRNWSFFAVLNL